jgi:hypothetical protein
MASFNPPPGSRQQRAPHTKLISAGRNTPCVLWSSGAGFTAYRRNRCSCETWSPVSAKLTLGGRPHTKWSAWKDLNLRSSPSKGDGNSRLPYTQSFTLAVAVVMTAMSFVLAVVTLRPVAGRIGCAGCGGLVRRAWPVRGLVWGAGSAWGAYRSCHRSIEVALTAVALAMDQVTACATRQG